MGNVTNRGGMEGGDVCTPTHLTESQCTQKLLNSVDTGWVLWMLIWGKQVFVKGSVENLHQDCVNGRSWAWLDICLGMVKSLASKRHMSPGLRGVDKKGGGGNC